VIPHFYIKEIVSQMKYWPSLCFAKRRSGRPPQHTCKISFSQKKTVLKNHDCGDAIDYFYIDSAGTEFKTKGESKPPNTYGI
jgi:hypothetical protein